MPRARIHALAAGLRTRLRVPSRPPHWLPWLGPLLAAGAGAAVGGYWLGGGFWTVLFAALVCGFSPIVAYRLWKRAHHREP